MKLHFYGGAESVTGANYLLEVGDEKIIIDCGMRQGSSFAEKWNFADFPYNPAEVQAVVITHAHLDHVGRLPKLCREGFTGNVYATHPTLDLAKIVLEDSLHIMKENARRMGEDVLYSEEDLVACWKCAHGRGYGEEVQLTPHIRAVFRDAGHILGSAIIEIYAKEPFDSVHAEQGRSAQGKNGEEKKIVFSGDLGNPPTPLLPPIETVKEADYLLVESVYGDRLHEHREERKQKLRKIVTNSIGRGGTLMIPSFAIERTQELLFELNSFVENGEIPKVPIFLDSPMAIKATAVYQRYTDYFNKKAMGIIEMGDDLFDFPGLEFTLSTQSSKDINDVPSPKVIIAGSGMSTGGRILHHERRYLPDERSTLMIIGYQPYGTLGRRLLEGADEVKIFGQPVKVNATIRAIGGYSAHADQEKLLEWIGNFNKDRLKKVFAVQGEEKSALALTLKMRDDLDLDAEVPKEGEVVEL